MIINIFENVYKYHLPIFCMLNNYLLYVFVSYIKKKNIYIYICIHTYIHIYVYIYSTYISKLDSAS